MSVTDILGFPADLTVWKLLNSQVLATFTGAMVALLVGVYGNKTAAAARQSAAAQEALSATEQARQIEEDADADAEAEFAQTDTNDLRDFRAEAKQLIENAKEHINKIATASDGRHQRTYKAMSRYDYIPLAVAMSLRKDLSGEQLTAAVELFSRWKYFERGRAAKNIVTQTAFDRLQRAYRALTKAG